MNNLSEYRSELDALHFSPDEIDAIARRATEGAAQAKKPRRRFPRAVLIAAALTAALAVGAGAAGVLPSPAEVFSPIFGGSAAQTEIIDKIGYPVDAGDSDNGITITADAVMGDAYNAAVVFTFRTDDGSPILPDGISAESLLVRGGGASANILGGSHGSAWFVDEIPGDDAVQMVQTISADRSLIGATADAEFDGLYRWDDSAGEAVALAEGSWSFRFTLGYEDTSVTLGGGETFTQSGMTFTIDAITLSPVAFKVDYTVASEVVWSNSGSGQQSDADRLQMQRYLENVEILLTKTDGTVVDLSLSGGSISPEDGVTVCSKSNVFSQILPMEELAGISVGGVYFPVPQA